MGKFTERKVREICAKYDIVKALRSLGRDGGAIDVGYEKEIGTECARGTAREQRGFVIPPCIIERAFGPTEGGDLIETETHTNFFGDLMAKTVLGRLGVQTFTEARGDIEYVRGGAVQPAWIGLGNAPERDPNNYKKVRATPKTIGCNQDVSRTLLEQTSPDTQRKVLRLILASVALGIEKAAFSGTGNLGQPCGIDNAEGVHTASITAGAPTRAEIVDMWASVAGDNADDGLFNFVAPSAVKAKLLTTADTGTNRYLYERGVVCDVAPLFDTNNATAKTLYAGDFTKLVITAWSGLDVTLNPFALSLSGSLRVTTLCDCDISLLEPKAFAVGKVLA